MKSWIVVSAATLSLSLPLVSCGLMRTPYQRPDLTLPDRWRQADDHQASTQGLWWERFQDPVLSRLVTEALRHNRDLAAATLRVRRAQLQAEQAGSDRLPSLTVQGSGNLSRNLGADSREIRSFAASAVVGYELDLWHRLGSVHDAARWEAMATEEDRASTALTLTGTTASLYWQIGFLNQRIGLSEASIVYARRTLELVQVQKSAGAATALEILEAERNLASQEASHTTLVQQRVEARNGLALLFEGPPQPVPFPEASDLEQVRLPEVAAGVPASLLARRPDCRSAESRVRAALATTDATRAAFYPSINLTGSLGGSSVELAKLLRNPVATLGGDLLLPFLQWRDMQRAIKISEVDYEQAVLTFKQTLYNALAEVDNSLSARQQLRTQGVKLEQTLAAARQVEEINRIRYQAGSSPLKTWLDAQENRRQAEVNLATNRLDQLQNHITLVKALGGSAEDQTLPEQTMKSLETAR